MHHNHQVKKQFNQQANDYDRFRRWLIPCFDEFYGMAVWAAQSRVRKPRILDLGAGTGIFSVLLQRRYPEASFVLVDMAESLLDLAQVKLGPHAACVIGDYTHLTLVGPFDLVVSALSIHHLTAIQKKRLFKIIYTILAPNGRFVNADQYLGATPRLDHEYKREWKQCIEATALPKEYRALAFSRMRLDKEDTLADQSVWMQQSGFKDVASIYQWLHFAVMTGRK